MACGWRGAEREPSAGVNTAQRGTSRSHLDAALAHLSGTGRKVMLGFGTNTPKNSNETKI